jgi:ferredoxin-type protein NapH
MVIDGECTNCGRCIDVCGDDALEFSIRNFLKK